MAFYFSKGYIANSNRGRHVMLLADCFYFDNAFKLVLTSVVYDDSLRACLSLLF